MKLLLIPDPTSPNGEDAFCREIAKRAAARGHQTQVQAIPNGPLQATLDKLSAAGFAQNADVVVINSLQPAALLAARAVGRKAAVRLIDSYASSSAQAMAEVKKLALQTDILLLPSRYLAEVVKGWGANGSVFQVPYAYDRITAGKVAVVTLRASRPTGFQLIAAGHLNESTRPGFETLLSAVAQLRLDCHLSVVGEGPGLEGLKEKARQFGAESRVAFLGAMAHLKMMEYFRSAKAYVEPCGLEGFPTLTLHALSEGCPVIAARTGAVLELIQDGVNGLLFDPGSAPSLSEAVVTLSSERGLSLKLIGEGVKTVERHSWDATVAAVFDAVESLR